MCINIEVHGLYVNKMQQTIQHFLLELLKKMLFEEKKYKHNTFSIFIYSILDVQNHRKYTYICYLRQVNSSILFYRTFHLFECTLNSSLWSLVNGIKIY